MNKELKTLNDLTVDSNLIVGQTELKRRIKIEAIKWVKEHRNRMWNWTEDTWRDFFNITEEDLP